MGRDADEGKMGVLIFDDFQMDTKSRVLAHKGSPVNIGSRAFDILATLAAKAGEIVEKHQLIQAVWPNTHVDEGALRVHLVALRRAIEERGGRQLIQNVPGKGYALTTSVSGMTRSVQKGNQFPMNLDPLIGREELVERLSLGSDRLRTLVGPGGVGKTSIALSIGTAARHNQIAVNFVDLTGVTASGAVIKMIGGALGVDDSTSMDSAKVAALIGDTHMLLILDGCERAIDETALVSEMLLRASPNLRILATSREQMRALGERVTFVEGLALPTAASADLLATPATRLFVERARAAGADVDLASIELKERITQIVIALEGIPLAIELAAGRVPDIGIEGVAQGLSSPLEILKFGRRTAPDRHKSMKACLEWSLSTLSNAELSMLQRLVESMSLGDSIAVQLSASPIGFRERDALDGLLAKSFVSPAFAGSRVFSARSIAEIFQEERDSTSVMAVPMSIMETPAIRASQAPSYH